MLTCRSKSTYGYFLVPTCHVEMQSRRATSSIKDKKWDAAATKSITNIHHTFSPALSMNGYPYPITTKILLGAFLYRQQHQNMRLYTYVILENLNKLTSSFKAHTARIKEQSQNNIPILFKPKAYLP